MEGGYIFVFVGLWVFVHMRESGCLHIYVCLNCVVVEKEVCVLSSAWCVLQWTVSFLPHILMRMFSPLVCRCLTAHTGQPHTQTHTHIHTGPTHSHTHTHTHTHTQNTDRQTDRQRWIHSCVEQAQIIYTQR